MTSVSGRDLLPTSLAESIERQTGGVISHVKSRAGGGASRQGAEVTVTLPDGTQERGYLGYDTRLGDPTRPPIFEREVAILDALSGPLAERGVNAPRLIAAEPSHFAILTAFTPGTDKWASIPDEDARIAGVRDFIGQLAALHRIDATQTPLAGFGDPRQPVSQRIRETIASLRAVNLESGPDPILILALDWLEENVPADSGPPVIVHGDAGPGNFLVEGDRCTALLDWELVHYGDPVEDVAQIWVRMLFNPFVPMREVLDAYEAASGRAVDIARLLYHRLYFQISFTVPGQASELDPNSPPAVLGTRMLFSTAHLRIIVQELSELTGIALAPVDLPDVPPGPTDRSFAIALDDIRDVIVPRAADQQAAAKAKSLARMIKFWRQRARYGAAFDTAEIAEVSAALGASFISVKDARRALGLAVAEKRIDRASALQLCHARMTRETKLMGDAMGWYKDTYFPPLD
ncbi:MAG: phosphotransferase family protein [Sphingobium sp.]